MSIRNSDQEVIEVANDWLQSGHAIYLVTVVRTWGSSPRPVGSIAAVRTDGELVGSVSGGCVEKQLVESLLREEAKNQSTVASSESAGFQMISTLHVDDEQARRVGLSCGGELELVFEPLTSANALSELNEATQKRRTLRRSINLNTGHAELQSLDDCTLDLSTRFEYNGSVVTKVFGPDWRILIIGAGQLSRYTAEFALALDYDVLVCDPRPGFKQAWQVADIPVLDMSPDDAVLAHATDSNAAVLALTHDPNLDDLALLEALPSNAFYVGALGSKRNYEKRVRRLAGLGLDDEAINRLIGPIGLDIGSRTSAEIAISIVAHLVQVRNAKNL
ncbi:MAG: XdhC family protein [Granulosicoccus sp.]